MLECDCSNAIYTVGILCTIVGLACGFLFTLALAVGDHIKLEDIKSWFREF
jgi:hypothetical protein